MATKPTIKTPIPTTSGFHNFALCTLIFALPNILSSPACQPIMTLVMQNKPNLLDPQMNVKSFHTVDYENIANWKLAENKPNTNPIRTQNKPNLRKAKMNLSSVKTMNYEQITMNNANKNKPNQTQFPKSQNEIKLLFNKGL